MLLLAIGGTALGVLLIVLLLVTRRQETTRRRAVEHHFATVQRQLELLQRAYTPTPPAKRPA